MTESTPRYCRLMSIDIFKAGDNYVAEIRNQGSSYEKHRTITCRSQNDLGRQLWKMLAGHKDVEEP